MTSVLLLAKSAGAEPMKVLIQEWEVPTPNSRPHDPAVGPDGSLWYTGQQSNTLGKLDPKTGKIKEYPVRIPQSGPHGLIADKEGNIWFTANYKGYIGKLNPLTGQVIEYRMPDPAASDPHSLVFDQKSILWFTVERGNFVGSLNPQTGEIRLTPSPTPNSVPYGIVVNARGIPYYCEFGTNKLASINPDTMDVAEHLLPKAHGRGDSLSRLTIWFTTQTLPVDIWDGLNPNRGKIEEWPSPGGPESRPYGITITMTERFGTANLG